MSIGYPEQENNNGGSEFRKVDSEVIYTIASRSIQTKLVGVNLLRARGLIINNATKDLYLYFGYEPRTPITASEPYTRISANGGTMFIYEDFVEPIYGIWASFGTIALTGNAIIHELSYLN